MTFRVLVCDPLADSALKILQSDPMVQCEVKLKPTPEQLAAEVKRYHAVIVRSETKLTADILKAGTDLKVVGRAGVGLDNIDVQTAESLGIKVLNVPGGTTVAVAELVMWLLMSLARPLIQASASLKAGEWKRGQFTGTELFGKRLGVVGYGRIGKAVAHRARAFEMDVVAYTNPKITGLPAEAGVTFLPYEDVLATSDYLTIHLPLNASTKNLIGADQFAKMKKGVRIVNCARGGILHEQALVKALSEGQVGGVALDVYEKEPPDHPHALIASPHVIAIPHLGASTHESQSRAGEIIARDVLAALHESASRRG